MGWREGGREGGREGDTERHTYVIFPSRCELYSSWLLRSSLGSMGDRMTAWKSGEALVVRSGWKNSLKNFSSFLQSVIYLGWRGRG